MKIPRQDSDGKHVLFNQLSDNDKRLMTFIDSLSGDFDTSYIGMEKAMSIRLNASNYPTVKAMAHISNNSLNAIVNDLLEVALGYIVENMNEKDLSKLKNEQSIVWAEWLEEVKKKEGR